MSYSFKRVLVTGAAGFIGCNFVRRLLEQYKNVTVVSYDKLTYAGNLENLTAVMMDPRHHFTQGDILDTVHLNQILRKYEIDTIVHFAAESHVDNSIHRPQVFVETNILGTYSLLEQARKYWIEEKQWGEHDCRFHHVSTDEVYGSLEKHHPAFTEKTAYAPNSPYSATKAGSDHLVRAYYHTYQLPMTISNCSNNYGPYQHPEKLIPTVIRSLIKRFPIPVYGDGSNIRDWLFVEDHCQAVLTILSKGKVGEVYNVGARHEISNIELVKTLCDLYDKQSPEGSSQSLITFVKDRPGHDWRYAINSHKIETELGWHPQESFESGLSRTLSFYQDWFARKQFV